VNCKRRGRTESSYDFTWQRRLLNGRDCGDSRPCCKLRLIKRDLIQDAGCGVRVAAGGQFSANRHLSRPACKGYANYPAGIIQHRRASSSPLRELKPGVPMQMPRVDGCGVSFRFEGRHVVTRANQDIDTPLPPRKE